MPCTLRLIAPILLALATTLPAADTEFLGPAATSLQPNPALRYWPAFDRMPHAKADLDLLEKWQTISLDDQAVKDLADGSSSKTAFGYLHDAARFPECNWGLDYSQGPLLLLPQLAKCRDLSRLACLRARWLFTQKQDSAAVDLLADTLCLGRHTGQDGILISLLVRFAIENNVINALAPKLPDLDAKNLDRLAQRLDSLPRGLTMNDTLEFETGGIIDWSLKHLKARDLVSWKEVLGNDHPEIVEMFEKDPEEAARELEALRPYFTDMQQIIRANLNQKEFAERQKATSDQFKALPITKVLMASYVAAYDRQAASLTKMTMFRAAITIATLQKDPNAIANLKLIDPINKQPITYTARPKGFTLTAAVTLQDKPVTLTIGPAD